MANYSFAQLEQLWIQAGGNPTAAAMAAAIAMAESGGNPDAINSNNSNGSIDRGLWQINSIHGAQSTTDPMANAHAAVSISSNGTNWRPWCTAWSNGLCGGTFLGSGAPYQKYITTAAVTGGGDNPLGGGGLVVPNLPSPTGLLDPGSWVAAIFKPLIVLIFYSGMFIFGLILIVAGIAVMIRQSSTGQQAANVLGLVATKGKSASVSTTKSAPSPKTTPVKNTKSAPSPKTTPVKKRTTISGDFGEATES